ncbi:MAG: hypothetical protein ACLTDR_11660 [Adlercreutzia equolifaciens]
MQLMTMDVETGTYHVRTWLLRDGSRSTPESCGIIADFDTRSRFMPFGIFTTGNENVHDDLSPFGASIFADAEDEIKAVDIAWDAFIQGDHPDGRAPVRRRRADLHRGGRRTRRADRGGRGHVLPQGGGEGGQELHRDLLPEHPHRAAAGRVERVPRRDGGRLRVRPELLHARQARRHEDRQGGHGRQLQLMRTVRKHENALRGGIQDVVGALLDNHRIHLGAEIEEDFGAVSVMFDDSVITDTQSGEGDQ